MVPENNVRDGSEGVEVVLIHRNPPCSKCLRAKAAVDEAIASAGVPVRFREIFVGTPEADAYGVVAPPMVLVGNRTVCAGFPPLVSVLVSVLRETAVPRSGADT